ncbi:TetR/AcrR family transcriptional regulator [Moritella sp. 24]|uniref:TetR/AcrR family transcriptional regulator n=1 Tax=Moritella sp. 24 TaxID=2746230 RepID=UPI001BA46545|nr:TetR/AcrR family transcriptional regulator [Moritella sp. 24]QUM76534.1 TetR/AcrR family transcriptional regulator [Moritella sp. 24]
MRVAEFDREKVLRSAMTSFMDKGYSKTSMQDLKKATGLHPGSIYCAFENKRGLLLAALEQYRLDRNTEFTEIFTGEKPVLIELKAYLDHIVLECQSCDVSRACLLTKALNEVAEQDEEVRDIITLHLANWQQAITQVLQKAIDQKEMMDDRNADSRAHYLMMGIYGLRTFAHTHPKGNVIKQLAEQLYQDVCR